MQLIDLSFTLAPNPLDVCSQVLAPVCIPADPRGGPPPRALAGLGQITVLQQARTDTVPFLKL